MKQSKPRVIKDFDKMELELQEKIKLTYPSGFSQNLVTYTDKDGKLVSALPFETEDKYYMVRMTVSEASRIIEDDEDYDDLGFLKDEIKDEYEEKYNEEEIDEYPDDEIEEGKDDDEIDF